MKIYPKAKIVEKKSSELYQLLKDLLTKIIKSDDQKIEFELDLPEPKEVSRIFFEKYYLSADNKGVIKSETHFDFNVSINEAEVLNYLLGAEGQNHPFIVIGHTGVGKSTLLKYITHYLYYKIKKVEDSFLPVYMSLSDDAAKVFDISKKTRVDFENYLDLNFSLKAHKLIKKVFLENVQSTLEWINANSIDVDFRDAFTKSIIAEIIEKNAENWLAGLKEAKGSRYLSFLFELLHYYTNNIKKVCVFLDDVDQFSLDIHSAIFNYIDKKVTQGFLCIVAMRKSTYVDIDTEITQKIDKFKIELAYSIDFIKKILIKNTENAEKRIKIEWSGKNILGTKIESINAFIRMIKHSDTKNTLANLSNGNFKQIYRIINRIIDSKYFYDEQVGDEILTTAQYRKRVWPIYLMLFGDERGSFESGDPTAKTGLINIFCSNKGLKRPYSYFTRLQLLSSLYGAEKNKMRRISEINGIYKKIFGDELSLNNVLTRSWFRLIQADLVFTKSCFKYTNEDQIEFAMKDDWVCLSPSGNYYLTQLINLVEYFYFMKDDIDWPDTTNYDFECAQVGKPLILRLPTTLKALGELMKIEIEMIQEITLYSESQNGNILELYAANFSAAKLNGKANAHLFTMHIWERFKRYSAFANNTTFTVEEVKKLNKEIDGIVSEKKELITF